MKRLLILNHFQITECGAGLLNRGVLMIPVKAIPEAYKQDEEKDKPNNGYLAVVDTVRYSISFIPLHNIVSNTRFNTVHYFADIFSGSYPNV